MICQHHCANGRRKNRTVDNCSGYDQMLFILIKMHIKCILIRCFDETE